MVTSELPGRPAQWKIHFVKVKVRYIRYNSIVVMKAGVRCVIIVGNTFCERKQKYC